MPFLRPDVAEAFAALPVGPRQQLLQVRSLILATAAKTPGVGAIDEALRWSEPSYLTTETKSGTTIRIHWKPARPDWCALYVHCQTNLVAQYRARHADVLEFEGNRAVLFAADGPLPEPALRDCITLALTYHQRK